MNLLDILRMGRRSSADPAPPPGWTGPAGGEIGEAVGVQVELLRSGSVAVLLRGMVAYAEGMEFDLDVIGTGDLKLRDAMLFQLHQPAGRGGKLPRDLIRLGALFADGRRATSLDFLTRRDGPPELDSHPLLVCRRAGGASGRWRFTWWLTPLPPPGPLTFECEWPSSGLPAARVTVDSAHLLSAWARSTHL